MTAFTPLQSLFGGALIGLAAVLLMALHGRIAGITGILSGILPPMPASDWVWRAAFLCGMILAGMLYPQLTGTGVPLETASSWPLLAVSGAIVGAGVVYGAGCTSGHGVCGLARLSPRSLAAVAIFMATAGLTVFVVRHVL